MSNLLSNETSPYLLQHKDNPVHWRAWGTTALQEAETSGKPILLSVGYSACHWCHVMAHESFENPEIAALMNDLFINIKVDREERPDLDALYQNALALLGQQGGWPLTMFLTSKGEPFWGGTYFPPAARYGRPGFPDVLRAIHNTFRRDPEKISRNRSALVEALTNLSRTTPAKTIPTAASDQVAHSILDQVDPVSGGVGGAPKFPQTSLFELLWRAYQRTSDVRFRDAVIMTAQNICQGGIYDHLGGGFARYSVDPNWLVPHFEKMLYDNALLIEHLGTLWTTTRSQLLAKRIAETVSWLLRELNTPDGAFAAALDADSEGQEGKFYTWEEREIDALLGTDAPLFKEAYGVTPRGNWEGVNILHRPPTEDDEALDARLAPLRRTLFESRSARGRPGLDDKVLTDWNGLAISALARVGALFGQSVWTTAAARAFAFIRENLYLSGSLCHSFCRGKANPISILDDYANMASAALTLLEVTGDKIYLDNAAQWAADADNLFWDDASGGYYFTAATDLILRTKSAHDAAVPPGNATMIGVLARLHAITGETRYRDRAESIAVTFGSDDPRLLSAMPGLLNNLDLLNDTTLVVVAGNEKSAVTRALLTAVRESPMLNRVLITDSPSLAGLPTQKLRPPAGPAAYICRGQTCSAPISDATKLARALTVPQIAETLP